MIIWFETFDGFLSLFFCYTDKEKAKSVSQYEIFFTDGGAILLWRKFAFLSKCGDL